MHHILMNQGSEALLWKRIHGKNILKQYQHREQKIYPAQRGRLKYFRGHLYERRPWIEGITLREFMASGVGPHLRSLVWQKCLENYFQQWKNRQVLHGDLKPENCILYRDSVGDWDSLWIDWPVYSRPGWIRYTPQYVAPEKIVSGEDSLASEIFSLSIIARELFAARSAS